MKILEEDNYTRERAIYIYMYLFYKYPKESALSGMYRAASLYTSVADREAVPACLETVESCFRSYSSG